MKRSKEPGGFCSGHHSDHGEDVIPAAAPQAVDLEGLSKKLLVSSFKSLLVLSWNPLKLTAINYIETWNVIFLKTLKTNNWK